MPAQPVCAKAQTGCAVSSGAGWDNSQARDDDVIRRRFMLRSGSAQSSFIWPSYTRLVMWPTGMTSAGNGLVHASQRRFRPWDSSPVHPSVVGRHRDVPLSGRDRRLIPSNRDRVPAVIQSCHARRMERAFANVLHDQCNREFWYARPSRIRATPLSSRR